VLENVGGQEVYSFTDGFSGYHQIQIAKEDCHKTKFAKKWGSYQYTVMLFGLKNVPAIFSRVVVEAFKEFLHKYLEEVVPMEYLVPSLRITTFIDMDDTGTVQERLAQLVELEEDRFIGGFHQQIQKEREKAYHDRHIKKKVFKKGDLVLVYDSKFMKNLGKFRMHWLGPYEFTYVTKGGAMQLETLNGEWKEGLMNGSRLKLYYDNQLPRIS
jgi:hypothetical protein